jgi:hypothetical protein
MNERIKEMWEESTGSMFPRSGSFTAGEYDYHLEKFAELIARDFAHYVDLMYGCPHGDFYAIEYVDSYFKENENVHKP